MLRKSPALLSDFFYTQNAVGSTQQDLVDTVTSADKRRQVIDQTASLSEVNETLNALQQGEIAGRAVLTP